MSKWTEEMIATVTRLWEQGFSASGIARTLGTVSRNAVVGKMHRMGVERRTINTLSASSKVSSKKKPHRFQWSDASIEALKRMWRTDCSAVEIARELGACKSAVYAKQRQLGLSSRKLQGRNRKPDLYPLVRDG